MHIHDELIIEADPKISLNILYEQIDRFPTEHRDSISERTAISTISIWKTNLSAVSYTFQRKGYENRLFPLTEDMKWSLLLWTFSKNPKSRLYAHKTSDIPRSNRHSTCQRTRSSLTANGTTYREHHWEAHRYSYPLPLILPRIWESNNAGVRQKRKEILLQWVSLQVVERVPGKNHSQSYLLMHLHRIRKAVLSIRQHPPKILLPYLLYFR